ncbi:MarR family winged helix-turn-helix transcriptional regulator [Shewanella baltica]|uniref:MarR family winged helix-turn-helix transcriptional regulator n=1 Tax=Shewanella TaxID=22 RepID=UPI0009043510|nr:MarR family transcriptional regulator [Shewanella sp. SACH]OUS52886.1 MarR family transcriptional regulator [Shewanella sp. SACH]
MQNCLSHPELGSTEQSQNPEPQNPGPHNTEVQNPEPKDALCLSDNVCFALYSASNALVRAYRPLLEAYELTFPQYLVMQTLWRQNGCSQTQLSAATKLDMGTLTPIVKRLEVKGLITRLACVVDERKKLITLTAQGEAIKHEALALKQTLLNKVQMDAEALDLLRRQCLALIEDLHS